MHIENIEEIIEAITNHTVLKLAGVRFPERMEVLQNRMQQIRGMLELSRRLQLSRRVERCLEDRITALQREIEGE